MDIMLTQTMLLTSLVKHWLVAGIPGYGKTNFVKGIALQALRAGVPVTILESAKREWREIVLRAHRCAAALRDDLEEVRLYQVGEGATSPLRVAPFEEVPGIGRDIRFGNLMRCLEATLPMEAPLPQIIKSALERLIYLDNGAVTLTFGRLLQEGLRIIDERGYSGITAPDIKGALRTRLDGFGCGPAGHVLSCAESIPSPGQMLGASKIIELDGLTKYELSLVCLFLLTRIWELARTQPWDGRRPRHLVILEEAHVLLGLYAVAKPDAGFADPQTYVTEMIVRMLQEFRALGIGLIVCDQTASALPPLVLKNVGTKVAFRVGDGEDRDVMANAMLLDAPRAEELGRLACGQAYLWTEGLYRPTKIRTTLWTEIAGIAP